jgi:hypothetical protein
MRGTITDRTILLIAAVTAAATLFYLRCADPSGGSEAGNARVIGRVMNDQGSPASNVMVQIALSDFDPAKNATVANTRIDTTATDGMYRFTVPKGRIYTIQAVHMIFRTRALIARIEAKEADNTAPPCTLYAPGTVKLMLPNSVDKTLGYVYIPGTTFLTFLNNRSDFVVLDSVPSGIIPAISYSITNSATTTVIRYYVPVTSNDTAVVYNPLWKYVRQLTLNTTPTGANVAGDVMDFPVLIRLTSSNFNFSQAQSNGADIRFTKSGNTFLPYEIERWDAANQQAEIWVKVDTVYGSDSTQFITLFWGNAQATDSSSGASVFDTSNGFIGVWHMNEDPSAGTSSIKDRTANAHDATPFGSMTASNSVDGAVGKALSFDGKDDYLNAGNVSVPGNYSVGLWVLLDTLGDYQRFIIKDSSYTLWYDKDSVSVRMEHMPAGSWWRGLLQDGGTRVPMTTDVWYYFVGTFDGAAVRLYANGAEASVSGPISAIPRTNSKPVTLGQATGHSFVNGIMDEIRIEGVARSADWIRLCYMNQRIDDKLVAFR